MPLCPYGVRISGRAEAARAQSDLFNKKPLELITDDLAVIVRAYREAQAKGQFSVSAAKKNRAKEKSDQRKKLTRQAGLFTATSLPRPLNGER